MTHTILRELKESDEAQSYILEKIAEIGSRIDTLRSEMTSLSKDRASMPAIEGAHMSGSERLQADIQTTKLRLDANRKTIARLTEQIATKNHAIGDAKPVDHGDLAASLSHQLDALRFRKRSLVAQGTSPAAAVSRGLDAEIDDTARRLDELRSDGQLASMATDVDDASPQDLLHELQVESVKLGDFLDSANKMYQGLLAKESTLPESQQRRISLIKRTEVEHTLLAELTKQLFQLDVHKISVKNKIAILEIAVAEESLRSPSIKSATIMGLTFGGIMSLFLAMTIERRHPTVIGRQDLESLNFRHVGTIPRLKFRRKSKRKLIGLSDSFGGAAFANASQYGAFVVLIKYIRTRIVRIAGPRDGGARVISVHSAMPGEGKTLVAMGMANSLASLRQRVLFLDSDVLGSRLRSLVPGATPGLVGVLANEASPEEVVLRDVLPFLDFMPPGNRTSVSTELLIGGRFAELIVQLKARYDYIIIDTPPVNIVPDSTIIAAAADIVVYVVSCHQTKVSQVEEALANLTFATDKPVQLIVNRATKAAISSGNYNYGVSPRSKAVDVIGKVAS